MAYEIIIKKRFSNKLESVLDYLKQEWGDKVANDFLNTIYTRLYMLQLNPYLGAPVGISTLRSLHVTKHNRIYYRINGSKISILNLYDTRSNAS